MGNIEAKSAIFESIRQNLTASAPFDAIHQAHHAGQIEDYASTDWPDFSREELIENFRQNLEAVAGKCAIVADEHRAAEVLREIIRQTGAKKIAVSDSPLVKKTIEFIETEAEFLENAAAETLFECDLGITSAQWAIAETGTLVLEAESERHRLASLVPPVHVCLLKAGQIRQTLGEILELTIRNLSRAITFITGASRTSDIELTLAIGVHGPGQLFVIVLQSEPPAAAGG